MICAWIASAAAPVRALVALEEGREQVDGQREQDRRVLLGRDARHRPRTQGESHYGVHNRLWRGLLDLAGVWWLKRRWIADARYRPMFEEDAGD